MLNAPHQIRKRVTRRRGAALVEFAVVAPVLIIFVMGMLEIGRAVMATEVLAHAARIGAREGSITTGTTSSVTSAVNDLLTAAGINGATVSVKVNGGSTEVGSAKAGDEIAVSVTVPYANVTWIGNPKYLAGKNLSGRCVMRREG
ncbi:MAG: pilus assembly protein [Planctomycetaceae bacterium]|nr:pilus assembly protein [Planctomycetaceae bacterium]